MLWDLHATLTSEAPSELAAHQRAFGVLRAPRAVMVGVKLKALTQKG